MVLEQPQLVAFGTVAELARQASTSGASVIRLATKLGFDGFSSLQLSVQRDLARQLRPATARIRQAESPDRSGSGGLVDRALPVELDNLQATLGGIDRKRFDRAVAALARPSSRVFGLVGEAATGIGGQFVSNLSMLRPGVIQVGGSSVKVHRDLAEMKPRRHRRGARPAAL